MKTSKFGAFGISSSVLGIALLLVTFVLAYLLLRSQSGLTPGDLTASMGTLLYAAIEALFLGIMGWVGSILLLRGIEFMKVEKGVGVVTSGVCWPATRTSTRPAKTSAHRDLGGTR